MQGYHLICGEHDTPPNVETAIHTYEEPCEEYGECNTPARCAYAWLSVFLRSCTCDYRTPHLMVLFGYVRARGWAISMQSGYDPLKCTVSRPSQHALQSGLWS